MAENPETLQPLVWYALAGVALAGVIIGLSALLGQRHNERATGQTYESGISSTGGARTRHSARFYLMAMFFVIFDLEAVFVFSWAVAAREAGWPGYVEIAVFIGVLGAALAYLWRDGALDWGPKTWSRGDGRTRSGPLTSACRVASWRWRRALRAGTTSLASARR
jgi:NADH-quinone oxidoreductase subunit A